MNLCKDCKYFSNDEERVEPLCLHDIAQKYDDPVWGNHTRRSCKSMRNDNGTFSNPPRNNYCGPFGKLWIAAADFTPMKYKEQE